MADKFELMYTIVCCIIGVLLLLCLVRAIRGPRIADRIIAINMMSTIVIITICVLAFLLHEGYLVDIAMIYAMISFLAVIILAKIYIGIERDRHHKKNMEINAAQETEEGKSNG